MTFILLLVQNKVCTWCCPIVQHDFLSVSFHFRNLSTITIICVTCTESQKSVDGGHIGQTLFILKHHTRTRTHSIVAVTTWPGAQQPAASTRLGWRCCQPRPQAATGTGPADTWQPLHSTGHTPPRHPAPALAGEDVVMAGLVWWCVSAVVPRLGCECGDDGRPRQSRGQRRPATGTGGLLIAGHCPPVSHCLPQHQNTIRPLYFFWASYFICSIHSIFIKWSEKTQINKYTTHYHWHTNWWLMAERRMDVCL